MTINVHGCETVEMTAEENAEAQFLQNYFKQIVNLSTHLTQDDLKAEFAKVAALPPEEGAPARYAPSETFFVMEMSVEENSKLPMDTAREYLFQMAFNAGAGSLRNTPPVLVRHIRGDLKKQGIAAIGAMFNR